jgi:hypothetical protein
VTLSHFTIIVLAFVALLVGFKPLKPRQSSAMGGKGATAGLTCGTSAFLSLD